MTDGDEDWLSYTVEEQRTLTEHLLEITRQVHSGNLRSRSLDLSLLRDFHAALFDGIRGHAGRIRTRGYGQEHMGFGPNKSVHRDQVERELATVFQDVDGDLRALEESAGYELDAMRLAVHAHAELIRIHPFHDGNGRVSRLCANHLLVRCGLRPVAVEVVKQDYTEALNHYFRTRELEPLLDIYVGLYPLDR